MSNPQVNALIKLGTLASVQGDVIRILSRYAVEAQNGCLCSHEILGLANESTIQAIADGMTNFSGNNSIPSSWIGSVAADLANQKKIISKNKRCPYTGTIDPAWHV